MSLSANYEQPAFPQTVDDMGTLRSANVGLTKREWLAGQALAGLNIAYDYSTGPCNRSAAERAVALADALLSELNKPPTTT